VRPDAGVNPDDREEGQGVELIALGIALLLLGLFGTVIVCSRMNDARPPPGSVQEDPIEGCEV
jgi:hypothetical protein